MKYKEKDNSASDHIPKRPTPQMFRRLIFPPYLWLLQSWKKPWCHDSLGQSGFFSELYNTIYLNIVKIKTRHTTMRTKYHIINKK